MSDSKRSVFAALSRGFTLVEVLASLLIVSVALAALAPVLALVAYRRVLSERIEVAGQLARAEVDRIRAVVDIELSADPVAFDNTTDLAKLPNVFSSTLDLSDTPAPTALPNPGDDPNAQDAQYSVRLVQIESPGRDPEEYAVQSFRSPGSPCIDEINAVVITNVPCSFEVGVRVYHRFSFDPVTRDARPGLETETINATQDLSNEDLWTLAMSSQSVELNVASTLGDICRASAVSEGLDPALRCAAFPTPGP